MSVPDVIIEPVGGSNFERTVQFLAEWVSGGEPGAREHIADQMPCAATFQMAAEPAAAKSPSAKARG
jgi:hypothetical protein